MKIKLVPRFMPRSLLMRMFGVDEVEISRGRVHLKVIPRSVVPAYPLADKIPSGYSCNMDGRFLFGAEAMECPSSPSSGRVELWIEYNILSIPRWDFIGLRPHGQVAVYDLYNFKSTVLRRFIYVLCNI